MTNRVTDQMYYTNYKIKKGKSTLKNAFSLQVTPEGFEPPTDGAEIRYSIQLNYGAIYK